MKLIKDKFAESSLLSYVGMGVRVTDYGGHHHMGTMKNLGCTVGSPQVCFISQHM